MLTEDWFLAVETIVNHSFQVRRGLKKNKTAVDSKEAGAVLGCLGSSALFVSTLPEIQLMQSFGSRGERSLRPFVQTCRDALVLSPWSALLVSVTGTGGNFSKTGAEGGSRSPEAGPGPTPGGPPADTGPLEAEVQLRSETETQN